MITSSLSALATATGPHLFQITSRAAGIAALILHGPRLAGARLPHGGVIVFDDASYQVIAPPPVITLGELSCVT